jgi:hypothetical protein
VAFGQQVIALAKEDVASMTQNSGHSNLFRVPSKMAWVEPFLRALLPLLFICASGLLYAGQRAAPIDDITGNYHFLSPQDTLAILDEEGNLSGYLDVLQTEDESDAMLSYPITTGSRQKERVEFKTGKIHQEYFHFSGTVQRGQGKKDSDPDYLRLVGDLEIVTVSGDSGKETVDRRQVVFQRMGKGEAAPE